MAKKKKKHHPDYDPDIACGSLYVQKEVAVQMMRAIAYALRHNEALTDLDTQRLRVGATVINDVFGLGAGESQAKTIELRFIEDPGHGWAEVPETLAKSIGLGTDFTYRNGMLYLEEDCELQGLEAALAEHGYAHKFVDCYVDDFDQWLDGDAWPQIPTGGG